MIELCMDIAVMHMREVACVVEIGPRVGRGTQEVEEFTDGAN